MGTVSEKFVFGEEELKLEAHRLAGIRTLDLDVFKVFDYGFVSFLEHLAQSVNLLKDLKPELRNSLCFLIAK